MIERIIHDAMETEAMTAMTVQRSDEGVLRWYAEFATTNDARAFKDRGHGGWVLGRYWFDPSWTTSQVMRVCPDSGPLH